MGMGLPHKANVGEIIRVRGYDNILFLVMEFTEEIAHEEDGHTEEIVTYTCRNVDNQNQIKIIFDEDILSIAVTADRVPAFLEARKQNIQPPAIREEDKPFTVNGKKIDVSDMLAKFERERKLKEQAKGKSNNNAPRSQWAKEREAKRLAYEYIDFLLERYNDLISMQQVMPHDTDIQEEIDLVRAEFIEKSGDKVVQDGKFS